MTAISGLRRSGAHGDALALCERMIAAQIGYGRDGTVTRRFDGAGADEVAFGRALSAFLPEDRFDRQPLIGGEGRFFVAADIQIDNRPDLAAKLGLAPTRAAVMSDADLLVSAFERWDEQVVDHLVGDFAFAVWDARERRLVLARDPFGQRPLCYHQGPDFIAFASMPSGIHASGLVPSAPDKLRIAGFMADLILPHDRSFYEDVRIVKSGQILTFRDGATRERMYWNPSRAELRLGSTDDYVEAFREHLDRAVEAKLRGAGSRVAAHLSSGWDSSAVAATAARLQASCGGRVLALTSAPRAGFDGPPPRGRINDESGVAAITAALYPNMDHVVLRPAGTPAFSLLKTSIEAAQHPLGHVCNNVWWTAINQAAAQGGVRVILTGETGNHTISAGNLYQLADLVRTRRWGRWSHEARALLRGGTVNWRGVLSNSFGPWLPKSMYRLISHVFLDTPLGVGAPKFLVPEWTDAMAREVPAFGRGIRGPRDSFDHRMRFMRFQDSGQARKMALARWGVDERDPTADRRLAEFCLSLPLDMLLKDGRRRPLARAALADRLPPAVLDGKLRGYQMADWYEQITREGAQACFAEVRDSAAAGSVIDMDRLGQAIDSWPTSGWERMSVDYDYRGDVLHALSAAQFMHGAAGGS